MQKEYINEFVRQVEFCLLNCNDLTEIRKIIFDSDEIVSYIENEVKNYDKKFGFVHFLISIAFIGILKYIFNIPKESFFIIFSIITIIFIDSTLLNGKIFSLLGIKDNEIYMRKYKKQINFLLQQLKEKERELSQDRDYDRQLARELKRKRAMGQIDDERLIYQYSQLQAIQNQSNQQAVEFFQQAQQALRYDRKSDLDYSLDQLERALGV